MQNNTNQHFFPSSASSFSTSSSSSPSSSSSSHSFFFLVDDGEAMLFVCKHRTKHWPATAAVNPAVELDSIINSLFYNGRLLTAQSHPPTISFQKKKRKFTEPTSKRLELSRRAVSPPRRTKTTRLTHFFSTRRRRFGSRRRRRRFTRCWSDTMQTRPRDIFGFQVDRRSSLMNRIH